MAEIDTQVQEWILLAPQAQYNARNLAKLLTQCPRQLQRTFRDTLGRSPQDWLEEQRILAARDLLMSGYSVKQVIFVLSFKQSSYFYRKFKAQFLMTPAAFVSGIRAADVAHRYKMSLTGTSSPLLFGIETMDSQNQHTGKSAAL